MWARLTRRTPATFVRRCWGSWWGCQIGEGSVDVRQRTDRRNDFCRLGAIRLHWEKTNQRGTASCGPRRKGSVRHELQACSLWGGLSLGEGPSLGRLCHVRKDGGVGTACFLVLRDIFL